MNKISKKRYREILDEEIKLFLQEKRTKLNEDVDHASIVMITRGAAGLLKAVSQFEEKANDAMKNALIDILPGLKNHLENMVQTPGAYVPKKPRKVIKLRATSED